MAGIKYKPVTFDINFAFVERKKSMAMSGQRSPVLPCMAHAERHS